MLSLSCRRGISGAAALALVLLVACSSPPAAQPAAQPAANSAAPAPAAPPPTSGAPREKTNVVLRLGWLARGYDAPYYYALARGYYDQAGVDVEIKGGQGSGATPEPLGRGEGEVGVGDGAGVVVGRREGVAGP